MSKTKRQTSYLEWTEFLRVLENTKGDNIRLLFAFQGFCGLRVGDVLALKWGDVRGKEKVDIIEKKTKKVRTVHFNDILIKMINEEDSEQYDHVYLFRTKFGNKPMSTTWVNKRIKVLFKELDIQYEGNESSHLFRKTFGRRYMELNDFSGKALVILSDVFGHSTMEITRTYLGIRSEEIANVYKSLI